MAGKTIQFPSPKASATTAHVVSAAPLTALLERVTKEAGQLHARAPHADVTACVESFARELGEALKLAENTSVFVTVEALVQIVHRPTSTITRICRNYGARAGATKVEGAWSIHLPTFQEFVKRGDTHLEESA